MSESHEGVPTISFDLVDYWYESISQKEGLKRLESRKLDSKTKATIAKDIPKNTLHYFSVGAGWFLELADFGDGLVHPLLLLPLHERAKNTYDLVNLEHESNRKQRGAARRVTGINLVELQVKGRTLAADGVPMGGLVYKSGPTNLEGVVITFLAKKKKHPCCTRCCKACEWVHSKWDWLHKFDKYCCLGGCKMEVAVIAK